MKPGLHTACGVKTPTATSTPGDEARTAAAAALAQLTALPSAQAWRLGRFVHFNSLSQWIGWVWPFLGVGYLAWRAEHAQLQRRARRRVA